MKCILHIGTQKTGTTTVQDWLYQNRSQLSNEKIYLSDVLGKPNNRYIVSYFQHVLDEWTAGKGIKSLDQKAAFFRDFKENFEDEIKSARENHELFVITSEHFSSKLNEKIQIENLKKFLDEIFEDVKIVCYFREQSDMAISLYSTWLKVHSPLTLDDFLETKVNVCDYYYNFKAIADNWHDVFGRDACVFRIYDRKKLLNEDIRYDFINALDQDKIIPRLDFSSIQSNKSLSRLEASIFRQINAMIPYSVNEAPRRKLNQNLKAGITSKPSLRQGKVFVRHKNRVSDKFKSSNKSFFDVYFPDEEGFDRKPNNPEVEKQYSLEEVSMMICEVLEVVLPYVGEGPRLLDDDAIFLRDLALKYESKSQLTVEDAKSLMMLARRAQPHGAFILKKLSEYKREIKNSAPA